MADRCSETTVPSPARRRTVSVQGSCVAVCFFLAGWSVGWAGGVEFGVGRSAVEWWRWMPLAFGSVVQAAFGV
jgi:hypothetical protein